MALAATVRRSVALGRLGVTIAAARRAGPGPRRDAARRLVAERMGQLRGLPQKIGQMLSVAEILDGADVYSALTDQAPPAPSKDAFRWIARELGAPLARHFRAIAPAAAAASLGQVHRATLHDGREVAVKIQYPEVAATIDADLAAVGMLATPLSARHSGFDLDAYRAELRRALVAELDYTVEASTLARVAAWRHDVPGIDLPAPIDGLCTPRLLTMTWVEGEGIGSARAWPERARHDALRTMLRVFLRGCFTWREVHADPHAGNLRFRRYGASGIVGYLDFGCTKTLTARECDGLWRLARHGRDLDDAGLAEAWTALGFPAAVTDGLRGRLRPVTDILFEPFAMNGPYDIARWQVADRLAVALGDDRWTFRFGGPASLLYVIRAFQGLAVYARALGVAVDWRQELEALPPPAMIAPAPDVAPGPDNAAEPALRSTHLHVEVVRDGTRVAAITFPATATAQLADLVPGDLRTRVAAHGMVLATLAQATMARGCPPGELIALDEAGMRVRVWLE